MKNSYMSKFASNIDNSLKKCGVDKLIFTLLANLFVAKLH